MIRSGVYFEYNNFADPYINSGDFFPSVQENPIYTPTRHNKESPAQQKRNAKKRRNKTKYN